MFDIAILVVTYNSAADLPTLLASIPAAAGNLTWHTVVVDNFGDVSLAQSCDGQDRLTFVNAGSNLGYSGGLNLGIRHAPPARFTVFLNPDLTLHTDALTRLVDAFAEAGIGAAVPLIVDANGRPQRSLRREPTPLRSLGEAVLGDHWPNRPAWLAEMVRDAEAYAQARTVEWATGAALMVRTGIVSQIGPWDSDRFFLYSEETDYARRIRSLGYTIAFAPTAMVKHLGAASGSGPALDALQAVNKIRYYRKWHGFVPSAGFFIVAVLHSVMRWRRPESRVTLKAFFSARARAALPGGGS